MLVKPALLTGSLVTGICLINWLHGICQPVLPPSVILWAIIWQLCMTKPQSSSQPYRSTCAATSEIYYSTISEWEQTGDEGHFLKYWKYPWPHLQSVQVCVGVSVPPHPALQTPLPAIRRSHRQEDYLIFSSAHTHSLALHYKCDS